MRPARRRLLAALTTLTAVTIALTGCGFSQTSPDLFVLQRTGTGQPVTVLVNDGGTIRCNGGTSKKISDPLLIQARDLADDLAKDAKAKLHLPARPNSVYSYRIRLPDGTIYFPDTAADTHHELAEAELFTIHTLQGPCRGR